MSAETAGDLTGIQAGAYRLRDRLASGGSSEVWSATAGSGLAARFAVKVFAVLGDRAGAARQCQREAQRLRTLRLRGIVELQDTGILPDGRPFLVMPRIDGRHFDEFCADAGRSLSANLHLAADVADVLAQVHQRGVVHGDLKPANVLIGDRGPVLIDFGTATGAADPTVTSWFWGRPVTPWYASPEVLAGGQPTARSDIWSFGVMLRDLLAAGAAGSPRAVQAAACIVDRCTSQAPADRFADGAALATALRRAAAGRSIGASFRWRRTLRHHWRLVAGALGALIVGCCVLLVVSSDGRTQQARAEALAVSEFLVRLLDQAAPAAGGVEVTLPEAWRAAEAQLARTFADKPSAEARVRMALGRASAQIGEWPHAVRHLQRAIDLLNADPEADPRSVSWCRRVLERCSARRPPR